MHYRKLGDTGLDVSCIGLGCAQIGSSSTEYAVRLVQRALELGINFFDVARTYRDSEIKIGLALRGQREKAVLSTKTGSKTRDDAWRDIRESLERLQTDYLDNVHLHGLRAGDDLKARTGPGGALEALIETRKQGIIGHIGCTAHTSRDLLAALAVFDFEVILVPMNVVERDPLAELIPLCQERGVGVTIMKPVATGLLPASIALKWLLNQPIASAVPGATTMEELEQNAAVGCLEDIALTPEEASTVAALREQLEHTRCRICGQCEPCPKGIPLSGTLGTDVMYDHYRTMGAKAFRAFSWSREAVEMDLETRVKTIAAIRACDHCGECEAHCPYGLPIIEMLGSMLPAMEDMVSFYHEFLDRQ